MKRGTTRITRRGFLKGSAAAAAFTIVPRHVLGGPGTPAPSDTFGAALIGCGGRGGGTFSDLSGRHKLNIKQLALCDVKFLDKADNKKYYTDFRRVVERKDIDIVAIATPPHWHALISIAAMECGKDVVCEKPMTRFVAEGRAVAEAEKRYKRIFQVGTYGREGAASGGNKVTRKIMISGVMKNSDASYVRRGGFKIKEWAGRVDLKPEAPPKNLDWDFYCGPSPLKPYVRPRTGGTHRWYWDYEGGGLADMGQHHLMGPAYIFGLDKTHPVEVEACAPPAHPEVSGMWAWSKLKYANGFTLVLESGEWGEPSGMQSKGVRMEDLSEADRKKVEEVPDLEPEIGFGEAVKTRQPASGNAEVSHHIVCLMHLTNVAIRLGRPFKFDPVTERAVGDEEANRLIDQPMRAPWHL
ncbi:MAG TPA: Gfo/Idh/MocA family oxidoreductase [Phycisphaerae bacterium]|nr:Gfo/Idh/MocA family oxidoreductase [Phycisphaerae bacterium]